MSSVAYFIGDKGYLFCCHIYVLQADTKYVLLLTSSNVLVVAIQAVQEGWVIAKPFTIISKGCACDVRTKS